MCRESGAAAFCSMQPPSAFFSSSRPPLQHRFESHLRCARFQQSHHVATARPQVSAQVHEQGPHCMRVGRVPRSRPRALTRHLFKDPVPKPRPPCDWCGRVRHGPSARLCRECEKCRSATYCCVACKEAAWEGGHFPNAGPRRRPRRACGRTRRRSASHAWKSRCRLCDE